MTLCLAWKEGGVVYFASDSRLSNGDESVLTEDAPKIFRIGVEVYNAADPPQLEYRSSYGLCFAGSYLNGSKLADTMNEILSNIQITPYSDTGIECLSQVAFEVYKQVSIQLMRINGERSLSEVLFGGECLVTKEFKLFKFSPITDAPKSKTIQFQKQEITLTNRGVPVLLGDKKAKGKATQLVEKINKEYGFFHLLRDVIVDSQVNSVGGEIQAGMFTSNGFKCYGIAEYSKYQDEYGIWHVKDEYKFRGLSVDFDSELTKNGDINILKPVFNPFESERIRLFNECMDDNLSLPRRPPVQ